MRIVWHGKHFGEEPPISGKNGSGTIFFSGCNLHCVYCQNWQISQGSISGKEISIKELSSIFLELQKSGCHNINLVSPTIWIDNIVKTIEESKKNGLIIPIVWNSNAYEKVEIIKKLDGLIDIYLPDYKYSTESLGQKYSNVKNYPEIAQEAILEMLWQVGDFRDKEEGSEEKRRTRGLIVRHLILPGEIDNSINCLKFIRSISPNIHLSLMSQYYPLYKANNFTEINRVLTKEEYEKVSKTVDDLDFKNGWIQEFEEAPSLFNPDFSKENPFGK